MNEEMRSLCSKIWVENKDWIIARVRAKLQSCPDEVDDVVADISYHFCVAILNNTIHTDCRGWLYAVTENCIKKKYEEMSKKRNRYTEYKEENFECAEDYSSAEELFLDSLIPESVIENLSIKIIDELKEAERQLYECIYVRKMKMKEIADKLEITVFAVRQRSTRLTKKIKKLVKMNIERI